MIDYGLIGSRIKKERTSQKLTQEILAERCNITVEYLSKIENGRVKPTLDALSTICENLKLDLSVLFTSVIAKLDNYQNDEIVKLFQACSPDIKPIALDLLKKLSEIRS